MTLPDTATVGFAFVCDPDGRILKIIHDDLGIARQLGTDASLLDILDDASLAKATRCFDELRRDHVAFDWGLNASIDGEIFPLHVNAAAVQDQFLVIGTTTRAGTADFDSALMGINNEDINRIRLAYCEARHHDDPHGRDDSLYEGMTRLNNELAAAQRDLAKKNAELERLNAQKNQLLGMAAHDLRNPLGVILNYSVFLLEETPANRLTEEQREFLDAIRLSSEFMARLVNDLLDISTIESGRLKLDVEPADLGRIVAQSVSLNRHLAERKSIRLELLGSPSGVETKVDAGKIGQVMNNLLTNAIKFSRPDTTIRVGIEARVGEYRVAVEDQGPGIPEAERERLFVPFGQTSVRSTAGEKSTGLGLAICRRIVEGHGGRIGVESGPGGGSIFAFTIPHAPTAPRREPGPTTDAVTAEVAGRARRLSVLIVDDQEVNRLVTTRLVERLGHRARTARDGAEAIGALTKGMFDLVLMDLEMAGMGGRETVAAIRERERAEGGSSHLRIVAVTGHDGANVQRDCFAAGFDAYLPRPIGVAALERVLATVVGQGGA